MEEGKKENHRIAAGLFTEAQLEHFESNPRLGYAFHFVYNGDHSGVKFNERDAQIIE